MASPRHADHRAAVGSSFRLDPLAHPDTGDEVVVELTLVEVSDLREQGGFANWSLLFEGAADLQLDQGMCDMTNDGLGRVEMFLVPIGNDGERATYESTFSVAV